MNPLIDIVNYCIRLAGPDAPTVLSIVEWEDIEKRLKAPQNHFRVTGLPLSPDMTDKVFSVSPDYFYQFGYLATDSVLNDTADQTGSLITADTVDYDAARFEFNTAQNGQFIYLFGTVYNPYYVAAELKETYPPLAEFDAPASLRNMNYSTSHNRETAATMLRRRGVWLNRPTGLWEQTRPASNYLNRYAVLT